MSDQQAAYEQGREQEWRESLEQKHPSLKAWPGKYDMTQENSANNNMALWNTVCVTNPEAVKPITGKPYKGNSPKPYWLIQRATEVFGPVGIGWGVTVKSERFVTLGDTDTLHVAVVSVWFVRDGVRSESFDQMGGTKAAYLTSAGKFIVDEDAGKKSVTDGMVKCLSMIGFAGDIFSGMWDDSKYVEWAAGQFSNDEPAPSMRHATRDGIGDDLTDEIKTHLRDMAVYCIDLVKTGEAAKAYTFIKGEKLEADQETWLASQMDSKTRAAIKAAKPKETTA